MSEILIDNITRDMLVQGWNQQKYESVNPRLLDKVKLQVPITFKGEKKSIIIINSKLILTENNNGVIIRLYSNFSKIILFSLLAGIFPSLVLLFSSILLFVVFAILISTLIFIMYYLNTQKISEKYLNKIKTNYFLNRSLKS